MVGWAHRRRAPRRSLTLGQRHVTAAGLDGVCQGQVICLCKRRLLWLGGVARVLNVLWFWSPDALRLSPDVFALFSQAREQDLQTLVGGPAKDAQALPCDVDQLLGSIHRWGRAIRRAARGFALGCVGLAR